MEKFGMTGVPDEFYRDIYVYSSSNWYNLKHMKGLPGLLLLSCKGCDGRSVAATAAATAATGSATRKDSRLSPTELETAWSAKIAAPASTAPVNFRAVAAQHNELNAQAGLT
ncbi:hypothetical protein V501_04936 [Pseudogymnoascus sp. VKM F-4519 (FW-2642)]|nr:hypothetical protein V501_04936 [Pseudogymnoascus sp. VKM F-4519 (FW-2642)]